VTWLILAIHLLWFGKDYELYGLLNGPNGTQYIAITLLGGLAMLAALWAPQRVREHPPIITALVAVSVVAIEIVFLLLFYGDGGGPISAPLPLEMTMDQHARSLLTGGVFLFFRLCAFLWILTRSLQFSSVLALPFGGMQLTRSVLAVSVLCVAYTALMTQLTPFPPAWITLSLGGLLQLIMCSKAPRS